MIFFIFTYFYFVAKYHESKNFLYKPNHFLERSFLCTVWWVRSGTLPSQLSIFEVFLTFPIGNQRGKVALFEAPEFQVARDPLQYRFLQAFLYLSADDDIDLFFFMITNIKRNNTFFVANRYFGLRALRPFQNNGNDVYW